MTTLSVVVTIVDGGAALERVLTALAAESRAAALEVLVPWDDSVDGIPALAARYPDFHFLPMGAIVPRRPLRSPEGQHELFDRRRAAGLGAATGAVIAILEDRGVPRPGWALGILGEHARLPNGAIGGAIENGRDQAPNWAAYLCDFGRYQTPFVPGPRPYVSDVNISYKRSAVEQTRALWRERYHETTVHWALQRAGETLYLSPAFAVEQIRDGLTVAGMLRERLGWGRLFAYTRAREASVGRRLLLAAMTPLLPFVLLARIARDRLVRRRSGGAFLAAAPLTFLLLASWSAGEAAGYLTGEA